MEITVNLLGESISFTHHFIGAIDQGCSARRAKPQAAIFLAENVEFSDFAVFSDL